MCENREPSQAEPDSLITEDLPEQAGKETQIHYRDAPVRRSPGQRIHERVPIPPVPEGDKVPDKTPSPPIDLD